jgi:hypothetical protein
VWLPPLEILDLPLAWVRRRWLMSSQPSQSMGPESRGRVEAPNSKVTRVHPEMTGNLGQTLNLGLRAG